MQIFKKPDLHVKEREAYLKNIEEQIVEKQNELFRVKETCEATKVQLKESLRVSSAEIRKQISEIDSILKIKQSERTQLEKPITERTKTLDERAKSLDTIAKEQDEEKQRLFEKDRELDSRLEGIKDLSDQLGETRIRLTVKDTFLKSCEEVLKGREAKYLASVSNLNEREKNFLEIIKEREYSLSLKEMDLHGKDENLKHRERQLLNGHILLNDQRGTLERAWKELESKKKK